MRDKIKELVASYGADNVLHALYSIVRDGKRPRRGSRERLIHDVTEDALAVAFGAVEHAKGQD